MKAQPFEEEEQGEGEGEGANLQWGQQGEGEDATL